MNSRQYEAMRLAEQEDKKPKVSMTKATLMRHLGRKSEDELATAYFDNWYGSVKELKAMVKKYGWTWNEAKNCKYRHLDCFLDPSISVYLSNTERDRYKKMFKKEMPFLFVRDCIEEVYWNPTLDDIIDFLETTAILLKDPDHVGLSGIYFSKEKYEEDGNITDFYVVTFSLDS